MATPTSPQSSQLPTRSVSGGTEGEAVPDEDSSETTKLFHERLQAWKHACGYLEDYIKATDKMHEHNSKEYEKVLKTVNSPLKEGHHFHQQNGGIAGMFENIRTNTQGLANSHTETAKTLKGSVLPTFERLHGEIKNKTKELDKGAGKGSKLVDKARNASQKQIEQLGTQTSAFDSRGGNVKAADDPYILQRRVYHHLNKQVIEENNSRDDMIAVQNNFAQFEAHVIQVMQQGLQQFTQIVSNQAESTRSMYGDMAATGSRVTPNFEWDGFVQRNSHIMIDPSSPKRSVEHINFPNQDHHSTRPMIAGSLERKSGMLKRDSAGYYVVTPSKYLHEFKSDDDFAKDPAPENSLYLPDCMIGAVDGVKFNVKGKDSSKGALSKMSMAHEYHFKAHTTEDARKWHDVISSVSGGVSGSAPTSPVSSGEKTNTGFSSMSEGSTAGGATTAGGGEAVPATSTSQTTGTTEGGVEEGVEKRDGAAGPPQY
ncbi:uncharacterized protein LTR77_010350 [Saxophila tyrrhenica]|uniref:PH domain-containing protein n=1 Tax=Saxophila tyrrhenica TaxID=1690608 RepID=A0AAV9NZN5_9PEZI|nr:hypothetical protein LTR77_010350 [Saxophila tyrrhenica]